MITDKLVIFDYDGVIADSLVLWSRAFDIAGRINNISYRLDDESIRNLEHITFGGILAQAGLSDAEIAPKYVDDVIKVFNSGSFDVRFFTGIDSLIKKIAGAGNLVCVNTANNTLIVKNKLEAEGVLPYIRDIAGGDVKGSKSEKIIAFMKKFSFSPADTFMIGDSLGDITEGSRAGVITVAAGYGWHSRERLLSGNPDYFCGSVEKLEEVFENHTA